MQITLAVKDLAMGEWMEQVPVKLPKAVAEELDVLRARYFWGRSTVIRRIVEEALPLISAGILRLIKDEFNRVPGEESNQSVPGVPKIPPMRRGDSAASPEELDLRGRRRVLAFSRLDRDRVVGMDKASHTSFLSRKFRSFFPGGQRCA